MADGRAGSAITRIPRAIAPLVTTITSSPPARRAATASHTRPSTPERSSPAASATIEEPSVMTTRRTIRGSLRTRVQLEDDAADLHVVARLEARLLQRPHHPDALQRALDVRQRLLVVEVVAR